MKDFTYELTPEDVGYPKDWREMVPPKYEAVAFTTELPECSVVLRHDGTVLNWSGLVPRRPVIVLRKVEPYRQTYGSQFQCMEDVWRLARENTENTVPQCGEKQFGPVPPGAYWVKVTTPHRIAGPETEAEPLPRIYAMPLLNKWQKIYGESVKDTNDPRMQALLEPDEEFEDEPRVPEAGEDFAGAREIEKHPFYRMTTRARWTHDPLNGLRAIIRKKPAPKGRFLKIPMGAHHGLSLSQVNLHYGTSQSSAWAGAWNSLDPNRAYHGATIVEE